MLNSWFVILSFIYRTIVLNGMMFACDELDIQFPDVYTFNR